jgi:alkanesulfonate monooxygenase SsuD/methylene tetrahydromethanopterin reductase-like flavin-dependent oxidoreductase (luciferase family)
MSYGVCPSALTMAGHLLGATRRIAVGTAVTVLSTHHPAAVAEQALLLDHVSGGRFRLGVGRGGPWVDLLVFGTGTDRYTGFAESLDLLLAALSGGPVRGGGPLFTFPEVEVVPGSRRGPRPEVVVAATSTSTVDLAARRGLPLLLGIHADDTEKAAMTADWARLTGMRGAHVSAGVAHVADTDADAVATLRDSLPRVPTLPAPLAATAERWFGRPTTITAIEQLSPGLRRISFHTPDLIGRRWPPGQEIEFRVTDREFRHYTAFAVDTGAGTYDVVFTGTATGPGTHWAWNLRPGDGVGVMGPGGGVRRGRRELLLGDATTLGLFAALLTDAQTITGAVEVPAADRDAASAIVPGLAVVPAGDRPGAALLDWLHNHLPTASATRPLLAERGLPGRARPIHPATAHPAAARRHTAIGHHGQSLLGDRSMRPVSEWLR